MQGLAWSTLWSESMAGSSVSCDLAAAEVGSEPTNPEDGGTMSVSKAGGTLGVGRTSVAETDGGRMSGAEGGGTSTVGQGNTVRR